MDRLQYIFPINITYIFVNICNIKLFNCKNIINYTSQYQIVFDKILNLINKNSQIFKKNIMIIL